MKKKFKLNKTVKSMPAGTIILLDCVKQNRNFIPTDSYWFRRYKDSFIDGCISIVEEKKDELLAEKKVKKKNKPDLK